MDQALIERLESSFNLVAPRGEELITRFYALLFSRNPEVRPMFPEQMDDQKGKLLASLVLVVQNLRTPEKLMEPLHAMGARHAGYGTLEAHYPVVRDTLVEVMAEIAGEAWSDQLEADWKGAVDLVSSIMLEGTAQARPADANGVYM